MIRIFFLNTSARLSKKDGFTLIEILIVIAIIGILSTIVLAQTNLARIRARDARRIADVSHIKGALELYLNTNQKYPDSLANLTSTCGGGDPCMASVPSDPVGGGYFYCKISNNSFHIGTDLEEAANPNIESNSSHATTNPCPTIGGDAIIGTPTAGCGGATDRYCYDIKR